jgi:hypothetical protein
VVGAAEHAKSGNKKSSTSVICNLSRFHREEPPLLLLLFARFGATNTTTSRQKVLGFDEGHERRLEAGELKVHAKEGGRDGVPAGRGRVLHDVGVRLGDLSDQRDNL